MKGRLRNFPYAIFFSILLLSTVVLVAQSPTFIQPVRTVWMQFERDFQNKENGENYETTGNPEFVDGYLGQGVKFTGDASVKIPYPQDDRRSGTIQLWFRPDWNVPTGKKYLLEREQQADLWVNEDGKLHFKLYSNHPEDSHSDVNIASTEPISWQAGEWFFIQVNWAFDEGAALYVNNELVAHTTEKAVATLWGNTWYLGNHRDGSAPADGTIDELLIMTRNRMDFTLERSRDNIEGVSNRLYRFDGDNLEEAVGSGTIEGDLALVQGLFGEAIEFVGNSGIKYNLDMQDKRSGTIELWLKPNWNAWEIEQEKHIICFEKEMNLSITADGKLKLRLYNNIPEDNTNLDFFSDQALPWVAGQWHHIQATWGKDRGAALYFDGALVGRTKEYAVARLWGGTLWVGRHADEDKAQPLNATIDDLVMRFSGDNRDFRPVLVGYQINQLEIPEGLSPRDDLITDKLPTFTWNQAAGACSYMLQYSKYEDFRAGSDTKLVQGITTNSFIVAAKNALPPGRWYWRVLAANDFAQSEWSETASLIISTSPAGESILFEGFEGDLEIGCGTWDGTITANTEYVTEPKREGAKALRWNYDFTNASGFYTELTFHCELPGKPKWIGLWVYLPEDEIGRRFTYRIRDIKGNIAQKSLGLQAVGWNYLELLVDIPHTYGGDGKLTHPREFLSILIEHVETLKKPGYIIIDELSLIYERGEATNLTMEITPDLIPADGNSTATITVTAKDIVGAIVPDGTPIKFSASAGTLENTTVLTEAGIAKTTITAATLDDDEVLIKAEAGWAVAEKMITMGQMQNWAHGSFDNQITVSSQNPSFPKEALTDGVTAVDTWVPGLFWAAEDASLPQWVELEFPKPRLLKRIRLYMYDVPGSDWWLARQHALRDYEVQIHDGTNWVSVSEMVGNTNAVNTHNFESAYAKRIRIWVTKLNEQSAKLVELEAWGPTNQSPVGTPQVLGPENEQLISTGMPTFKWEAVPGAEKYVLQYSKNPLFKNEAVEINNIVDLTFIPSDPIGNGLWYWRVAAQDQNGIRCVFSSTSAFTVSQVEQVAPPLLLSPAEDAVSINRRPKFTWKAVEGATSYLLEYTIGKNFYSSEVQRVTLAGVEHTVEEDLVLEKTYSWRVRAFNADGDAITVFSPANTFQIFAVEQDDLFTILLYTNPFRLRTGSARIGYLIGEDHTKIRISIYNMAGKLVKTLVSDEERTAGYHQEFWDGKDQGNKFALSGPYVINCVATDPRGRKITTRKVMVVLN